MSAGHGVCVCVGARARPGAGGRPAFFKSAFDESAASAKENEARQWAKEVTTVATTIRATPTKNTRVHPAHKNTTMSFTLPTLPYDYTALEPYIDGETMHVRFVHDVWSPISWRARAPDARNETRLWGAAALPCPASNLD
jgi:hypothetical protein